MEGEEATAVRIQTFCVRGGNVGPIVDKTGMKEEIGKRQKWGLLGFEVQNSWRTGMASRKACQKGSGWNPFVCVQNHFALCIKICLSETGEVSLESYLTNHSGQFMNFITGLLYIIVDGKR